MDERCALSSRGTDPSKINAVLLCLPVKIPAHARTPERQNGSRYPILDKSPLLCRLSAVRQRNQLRKRRDFPPQWFMNHLARHCKGSNTAQVKVRRRQSHHSMCSPAALLVRGSTADETRRWFWCRTTLHRHLAKQSENTARGCQPNCSTAGCKTSTKTTPLLRSH